MQPEDIKIHPQCVAAAKGVVLDSPYLIYHEKVKTSCVFMRDATPVSPHALVLFGGGSLKVDDTKQSENRFDVVLRLDEWIGLSCPRNVYEILLELRKELDAVMRLKIEDPKADFSEGAKGLIDAVEMLLEEGREVQTAVGGEKVKLDKFAQSFASMRGGNQYGGNQYGGNQLVAGQPMSFWRDCYTCAACRTNISGEIALIQHCAGSKHAAKNGGRREFAGLVPNKGGVTPNVSPKVIEKIAAAGRKQESKSGKKNGKRNGYGNGYGNSFGHNNFGNNNSFGGGGTTYYDNNGGHQTPNVYGGIYKVTGNPNPYDGYNNAAFNPNPYQQQQNYQQQYQNSHHQNPPYQPNQSQSSLGNRRWADY
jgi:hypothetical protein